jgi:hypothetical protein
MKKFFPLLFLAGFAATAPAQTSVQEAYKVFQAKCISCHDHASPEAGLDLEGAGATELVRAVNVAQQLVNVNPSNAYAAGQGYKRVYPGRPDRSFLFRKINGDFELSAAGLHAEEGSPMPAYPGTALTPLEKEILRQWIVYGAKSSGIQFDKALVEDFYTNGGERSFPDGPPPAPPAGEGFQIKMGPFYLPPGEEVEYYQKYELKMPENVEVDRLEFMISGYSHHYLLYNFTNAATNIPPGLRLNANHSDIGLVAAVQGPTDLKLPANTAFKWDKNLVLDLNTHYINYSQNLPYQCEAYVNVYTNPAGTAQLEMFADLLVNPFIPIPNNGNPITHTHHDFQVGADTVYVWGLMGHTHKYGTGYKIWKRLPFGQYGELIYDGSCPGGVPGCPAPYFDYRHIPLRYWEPLLPIKWSNGIIQEATFVNDGPAPVNFGPTSDDEMMIAIAFYTLEQLTVDAGEPSLPATVHQPLVFPNPAEGETEIRLPGDQGVRSFRLFDAAGKLMRQLEDVAGNRFRVDLEGLAPGVYLFRADRWSGKIIIR